MSKCWRQPFAKIKGKIRNMNPKVLAILDYRA